MLYAYALDLTLPDGTRTVTVRDDLGVRPDDEGRWDARGVFDGDETTAAVTLPPGYSIGLLFDSPSRVDAARLVAAGALADWSFDKLVAVGGAKQWQPLTRPPQPGAPAWVAPEPELLYGLRAVNRSAGDRSVAELSLTCGAAVPGKPKDLLPPGRTTTWYRRAHDSGRHSGVRMSVDIDSLPERLRGIRRGLESEYRQPHQRPWIVGFSGGKDSSLLLHLVVEMLLDVAPSDRTRPVYVVSNDTRVESPVYQAHVDRMLDHLEAALPALRVPVSIVRTGPEVEQSFWVNLLGRGYPAPNRNFRWCTDRMKIRPTTRFVREQVSAAGEVILLLGVRAAESPARAQRMEAYREASNGRLSPHNDIAGCFVYQPIARIGNDEVWILLLNLRPPWGGSYDGLRRLYHDASGGECPFVVDDTASASCGTGSARFGCWTCTVVTKDKSLDALVDQGWEQLEPLGRFRERIAEVSCTPEYRSKIRRDGSPGLGPLTLEARQMLLAELLELQAATSLDLISAHEVRLIEDQWLADQADAVLRELERFG